MHIDFANSCQNRYAWVRVSVFVLVCVGVIMCISKKYKIDKFGLRTFDSVKNIQEKVHKPRSVQKCTLLNYTGQGHKLLTVSYNKIIRILIENKLVQLCRCTRYTIDCTCKNKII